MLRILVLLGCLLVGFSVESQTSVKGKVQTMTGKPIKKAVIYLDSVETVVQSNKRGVFKITVPDDIKSIGAYAKGYGYLSTAYNKEPKISIIYIDKKVDDNRDNYFQTGYGEFNKNDTAMSIDKLNVEKDLKLLSYNTIFDYLRGKVPGVNVVGTKITIRGVNTVNGSTDPLLIVNGVPTESIDHISPFDIKEINVLKGPETAMYGSRGANGVILISLRD